LSFSKHFPKDPFTLLAKIFAQSGHPVIEPNIIGSITITASTAGGIHFQPVWNSAFS
jgi:hypothetical protein